MTPYSEYKDSGMEWIGEIPKGWSIEKLGRHVELHQGTQVSLEKQFFDSNLNRVRFLRISDFTMNPEPRFIESKCTNHQINHRNLVVIRYGENAGSVFSGEEGVLANNLFSIRVRTHNLNQRYLLLFLQQEIVFRLLRFGNENTAMPQISHSKIHNLFLPCPPLSEQTQIVSFLDTKTQQIDELIQNKERKIKLLQEKRTAVINQAVTKGLNPEVEMKDSGVEWIGEIPKGWDLVSIKHLVSTKLTDGHHETPNFVDDGIPFISVESVRGNIIDFDFKRGYITKESHEYYSKKCKPKRDDVLLVKSGSTTGKSTIVETDTEFNIWSPLCLIRSKKELVTPRFMFISLQSSYFFRFIETGWSYGTQPNIGMGVIKNIQIITPSLPEQTKIVSYLDTKTQQFDDLISKEQRKIELLKEYRQSLISDAVTGKIDVRDVA